ncbi:MAG TPA: hypothetical protein VGS03_05420 [Candidatus Polarisedimenticolia bacterium]|nr:hypothetical protein [Candidatus Polarisedimenticolia bacterium]
MARTAQADYRRSLKVTTLPLPDPDAAARIALRLLDVENAEERLAAGQRLLDLLAAQTGIPTPELVVPDERQPHRRSGGRIVYSLQGDYRRRRPSPADPNVARGGKPLGRIRVPHRTPARGDVVRPGAFLHTLLHEFCHHHDWEALELLRSFHTAGFYARLRDLRSQVEPPEGAEPRRVLSPLAEAVSRTRRRARPRTKQAPEPEKPLQPGLFATLLALFKTSS